MIQLAQAMGHLMYTEGLASLAVEEAVDLEEEHPQILSVALGVMTSSDGRCTVASHDLRCHD